MTSPANAQAMKTLWALNDWLACAGYGFEMPDSLRRRLGLLLADSVVLSREDAETIRRFLELALALLPRTEKES